jgi:hypothetical protein
MGFFTGHAEEFASKYGPYGRDNERCQEVSGSRRPSHRRVVTCSCTTNTAAPRRQCELYIPFVCANLNVTTYCLFWTLNRFSFFVSLEGDQSEKVVHCMVGAGETSGPCDDRSL